MKPIRFLHIPKTAGSTFRLILRRQYLGKMRFEFSGGLNSDIKRFKELSANDKNNIVLFLGHAPFKTGISSADNATIITFLRDPINRVKSFCQHVAEGKSMHLIDDFPPETFNLDKFLDSGNAELSNLQTKMLINPAEAGNQSLENLSSSEAKDAAIYSLLNDVSHFGLQEYFDESLIVFSTALNWKMPFYASLNKRNTSKLIHFDKHHLNRIAELNAIDIEVYNKAREHFLSILESELFTQAKLKRFQLINPAASIIIKSGKRISKLINKPT